MRSTNHSAATTAVVSSVSRLFTAAYSNVETDASPYHTALTSTDPQPATVSVSTIALIRQERQLDPSLGLSLEYRGGRRPAELTSTTSSRLAGRASGPQVLRGSHPGPIVSPCRSGPT